MLSSQLRYSLYGSLVSLSLLSLTVGVSAGALDGVFGDYFRNIITNPSVGPCSIGYSIVTGFSNTPATYGTRQCVSIAEILGATTANIGIGTATPTAKLDILGTIKIVDGTQSAGRVLTSDATGLASWGDIPSGGATLIGGQVDYLARWLSATTLGTGSLYDNGTNIGIGTTTPSARLDVAGDAKINGMTIGKGSGSVYGNTALGSNSLVNNTTGNGNTSVGQSTLRSNKGGYGNTALGLNALVNNDQGNGNTAIGSNALYTNFTSGGYGNTAIGTSALYSNTYGNNNTAIGYLAGSARDVGANNIAIGANVQFPGPSYSSNKLNIGNWIYGSGGDIGIGTNSPTTKLDVSGIIKAVGYLYSSDIRLKSDIMAIDAVDSKINAINGVTFRWKDTGKMDMGFIAQDIEKVLPEIVHTDTKGMKSVEYANITALLIEGYKYQKTRADSLETRVSALEKATK